MRDHSPSVDQDEAPQPPRRVQFVVYVAATGQILRAGTCAETDLALQARPGEAVIEGEASDDAHYIVDGQIIDLPHCPGEWAEFDFAARVWVDPRSPAEAAAEARAPAIAAARAYLAETDWYVTRQAETGTPIPDDIAAARAEARATASS